MFNFLVKCCLGLAICTAFTGCTGQPGANNAGKSDEELNQTNSKEDLKKRLLEVAESGEGGSSIMGIRVSIEEIRKADSSIGDEILTLCEQLESEGSAAKIKSIAKKMADML